MRNSNRYHPHDWIEARYPRLIRAMKFAACLCDLEAISCIQMHLAGHAYAGEAVNHYGGNVAVLRGAIRCRHATIRAYGPRQPMRIAA